jgi:hypothetical protein
MSGTTLMLQPLPPQVPEFVYATAIKSVGAEELSSQERIQNLLDLPAEDLATLIPPTLPLIPVVDGDIIPGNVNFEQMSSKDDPSGVPMPGRKWCEELLIGDCQFDVSFLVLLATEHKQS